MDRSYARRQRPVSYADEGGDESDPQLSPLIMRRMKPRPSSLAYLDDPDLQDSPPPTRRAPAGSSRTSKVPYWSADALDSPPPTRRTTKAPTWTDPLDSPPVIRRTPQIAYLRRAYVRPEQLVCRSPVYDLSDEEPLDTNREQLTWQRMFDPMTTRFPGRDICAAASTARHRSLSPQERSTALRFFDQSTEEYDDALIQRSRQARVTKPTSVRPWQLRIPKFVPTAEFRQPQPKPEVRRVKGRSLRTEEKVLINYHIARGKLASTKEEKKSRE